MSITDAYREFQGHQLTHIPERPGLYAWYYRPASFDPTAVRHTLTRFFSEPSTVETTVSERYGRRMVSSGFGEFVFGSDRLSASSAIREAHERAGPFLTWFFRNEQFAHFCRPIYIGIAKDLYARVYVQHYESLIKMWDEASPVSRFLASNETATVQTVMDSLELNHSFALEARILGIAPRDLMVSVLATDEMPEGIGPDGLLSRESDTRRALERMLQLLADPICGRR